MKTIRRNADYRPYNGHPNWQLWNVTLWFLNDEQLYLHTMGLIEEYGLKGATAILTEQLKGQATPDGAEFNKAAIRYAIRFVP